MAPYLVLFQITLIIYGKGLKKGCNILTVMELHHGVKPQLREFFLFWTLFVKKTSIKRSNFTKICRVIKEGPKPGSNFANSIVKDLIRDWLSVFGPRFTTNDYMKKTTSSTVAKILEKYSVYTISCTS